MVHDLKPGPSFRDGRGSTGVSTRWLEEGVAPVHAAVPGGSVGFDFPPAIFYSRFSELPSLSSEIYEGATLVCSGNHHRFPSWQLHTVLQALMGPPFEPIRDVDLKWVQLKTIFLVAITSAPRVSELGALSCRSDLCIFH